jgi:hypothetical protein
MEFVEESFVVELGLAKLVFQFTELAFLRAELGFNEVTLGTAADRSP